MKIDYVSHGLRVRLLVLLVIGLGLPLLTMNVATQEARMDRIRYSSSTG